MEFHDILHGRIIIDDKDIEPLVAELLNSPEINRLRNMRQMNFDVPLIQELGRSRRLPHTIGVVNLTIELSNRQNLSLEYRKALITAAMLHDAAIPPYGHLVESEFKQKGFEFKHEDYLNALLIGQSLDNNMFNEIVPGLHLDIHRILQKHDIDPNKVKALVNPQNNKNSPLAADIDIDNIDNVHRMALMLGWDGARENLRSLVDNTKLNDLHRLQFENRATPAIEKWLSYREKIYTLIIAHPECIPQNALQTDLVRTAVENNIISLENWKITEPEFEELLRNEEKTKDLATQLISGCTYHLVDYVWFKNIKTTRMIFNSMIAKHMEETVTSPFNDAGYFIWYENGLISRKISWSNPKGGHHSIGEDSCSCMVALLRKPKKRTKWQRNKNGYEKWRNDAISSFIKLVDSDHFRVSMPEEYTGSYFSDIQDELFYFN